ncbi:MAG: hypothetical protein WCO30_01240 [bacterium]
MSNMLGGITLAETRGAISDLMEKLSGEHDVEWLTALKKFLRRENPWEKREWRAWKTIKLGTFKNVDEIRKALKAGRHSISDWAKNILGKPAFKVSETEQDVELVNISVEELGFKEGARYADICKRALEFGLNQCPAEVGPQLRLQFKDQPKGTYVVVAMEAIADSNGDLSVFYLKRYDDGECCLLANYGHADYVWDAHYRFVFLRRK